MSLATKITVMILVMIIVSTVSVGVFSYIMYRNDTVELAMNKALVIVQSVAALIDPAEYSDIMYTMEKNDYFFWLQQQMGDIRDAHGFVFLHAGYLDRTGYTGFVQGSQPGEEVIADLGSFLPASNFLEVTFDTMRYGIPTMAGPINPQDFGIDLDGFVVVAYSPIFDGSNNVIGFVGGTMFNANIQANSNAFARNMVIIVIVAIALLIWLPMFYIRRYVGKPLEILTEATSEISKGNFNVNMLRADDSEVGKLAQSFTIMQQEISGVIDEIQKKNHAINSGRLHLGKSSFSAKGDFQKILNAVDNMAQNASSYLNDLECSVLIFDAEHRFSFINNHTIKNGYDPAFLLGKTIYEVMPPNEAEALNKNLDKVRSTGESIRYQIDMISPAGDPFSAEQVIVPKKDSKGNIATYLILGYTITDLVQAQKRAEKINNYQDVEASNITKHLHEGLSKGLLHFDYTAKESDADTAKAAKAYTQIGETMEHAVVFIKGYVDEISHLLKEFSNENFDVSIKQNYMGDFGAIKQSMERMIDSIRNLVTEIQSATAQVESGAEVISQATHELTASFEEQTAAMTQVTEAVDVLTDKTQRSASDLQSAGELSIQVQEAANVGTEHMNDLSRAMEEIKQSSAEIAKVASIIEGIAFQTNLLALNASVEAARAGEHGKGFAVVAEEVRNLAGRSSTAAKETADMITKSLSRVDEGVAKSVETAQALQKINTLMSSATNVIAEVASVSSEQAAEVTGIKNNIEAITHSITVDSATVQNNAAVAEELTSQVHMLMSLVERFKVSKK